MHQILFPASVRSSVRLLDGVWHLLYTWNWCRHLPNHFTL